MLLTRLLIITLALLPFSAKMEAGFWDNLRGMVWKSHPKAPPLIDVLVINDKPGAMLDVRGNYQLKDPNTKQLIGKRYMGKRRYIQSLASGLRWGEEFPGIYQLQLIPEDQSVSISVDGVEYRGMLYIYDIGGTISIVNRVPIEDYLISTLPKRYQEHLPEEALSAIAITARTDALYKAQNPTNRFWSVDGAEVGYRGVESELEGSEMERAIHATRHMVLSKTGAYEGVVTPFPATWEARSGRPSHQDGGGSRISVSEAGDLAKDGQHAAQILSRAYPGSHIEIIY